MIKKLNLSGDSTLSESPNKPLSDALVFEPDSVIEDGAVIDTPVILERGCTVGNNVVFNGSVTSKDGVTFGDGVVFNGEFVVGRFNTLGDVVFNSSVTFQYDCTVGDMISNKSVVNAVPFMLRKAFTRFRMIYLYRAHLQGALRVRQELLTSDNVVKHWWNLVIFMSDEGAIITLYDEDSMILEPVNFDRLLEQSSFNGVRNAIKRDISGLICHLTDSTVQDIKFPIVENEYLLSYYEYEEQEQRVLTVDGLVAESFV